MKLINKYKAKLFRFTFIGLVVYNTVLFGYGLGFHLSQSVIGATAQATPREPDDDDSRGGVYIHIAYLEISEPPRPVQKTVTVACTGPDGKQMQLTEQACSEFQAAWDAPTP